MDIICNFCEKKSQYTCPRCNVQYCSSVCFRSQKHEGCSENFFKKMVEEELKNTNAPEDSKKKMEEILKRNAEIGGEESDDGDLDSDDDEDIADRMKGVNLDDSDAVWSKLTPSEQEEFQGIISSGDTSELIPPYEPWWENSASLVQEIDDDVKKDVPTFIENCPPVVNCPLLSSVTKVEPSPCIPFNILNVLAAYIWVVRLFNGDHEENCVDATEALFTLSPVLSKGANYESAEVAVETPKVESQNHLWLCESEEFSCKVKEDLRKILTGPTPSYSSFYVAAALSDIHALFTSCIVALQPKKKKSKRTATFVSSIAGESDDITKVYTKSDLVKASIKKMEFFLSYIKEYPENVCK